MQRQFKWRAAGQLAPHRLGHQLAQLLPVVEVKQDRHGRNGTQQQTVFLLAHDARHLKRNRLGAGIDTVIGAILRPDLDPHLQQLRILKIRNLPRLLLQIPRQVALHLLQGTGQLVREPDQSRFTQIQFYGRSSIRSLNIAPDKYGNAVGRHRHFISD